MLTRDEVKKLDKVFVHYIQDTKIDWNYKGQMDKYNNTFLPKTSYEVRNDSIAVYDDLSETGSWLISFDCLFDGMSKAPPYESQLPETTTETPMREVKPVKSPVKSDGGSSDYYKLLVNGTSIETEDIIRDVFGNDFDFGNNFKSLVRAYKTLHGVGKEGNSLSYECNKIDYSTNKIRKQEK